MRRLDISSMSDLKVCSQFLCRRNFSRICLSDLFLLSTDELPQLADILGGEHPQLSENNQESLLQSSKEAALRKLAHQEGRGETYQASVQRPYSDGHDIGGSKHGKNCPPGPPQQESGRPSIESINSTVIALIGSQISLNARFCCHPRPKKVYWIHRHLAMMPQRIIGRYMTRELIMARTHQIGILRLTNLFLLCLQSSNSQNCFTSTFIIDSVKPEDAGDVMFIVLNSKGIDQALVSVNVTFSASYTIASNGKLSDVYPKRPDD